ncbi:MAG: DUF350 domain-containing protein [Candidatus Lambdaproteobacteria bacterium]|nr:DUF350 domain-containing protein [Candidatus Lambdaproteobacteria bacterium]
MEIWALTLFPSYLVIGFFALVVWWLIYDRVLTRGYSVRDAVFGNQPNPAVAMDLLGGLLASGILVYAMVTTAPSAQFRFNVLGVAANGTILLVLLAALRLLVAGLLRLWFGDRLDAQGERISLNNELFRQRNLAASLFSGVLYLILAAGLAEQAVWITAGFHVDKVWNVAGTWLFGLIVVVLHSFLYLGYGPRNNILHECFHDNNPAAACSLLGLIAGMLPINHGLLVVYGKAHHWFNTPELWAVLGGSLVIVLAARTVLQLALWLLMRINLRYELVIHDNVAWGLLDGGVIFSLCLVLFALMV